MHIEKSWEICAKSRTELLYAENTGLHFPFFQTNAMIKHESISRSFVGPIHGKSLKVGLAPLCVHCCVQKFYVTSLQHAR